VTFTREAYIAVGRGPSDDGAVSRGEAMDPDHRFRMALIAGVFLVLPVGVYHRVRSQVSREHLTAKEEP
jgi:hypothetical protein